MQVWRAIGEWSAKGVIPRIDKTSVCFLDRDEQELDPPQAFEMLMTDDQAVQVVSFFSSPFIAEYGEPRTEVQVWFEKERTELIVTGRAAFTGDFDVDIQNYVLYLQILRAVALLLKSTTFSWGAFADQIPMQQTTAIRELYAGESVLSSFNAMRSNSLPVKLETKFLELVQTRAAE
ncbi:hypothetical protein BH10CYA1_BH10CYA1_48370 [soil metagenome]